MTSSLFECYISAAFAFLMWLFYLNLILINTTAKSYVDYVMHLKYIRKNLNICHKIGHKSQVFFKAVTI